jgi:hypothetical protein
MLRRVRDPQVAADLRDHADLKCGLREITGVLLFLLVGRRVRAVLGSRDTREIPRADVAELCGHALNLDDYRPIAFNVGLVVKTPTHRLRLRGMVVFGGTLPGNAHLSGRISSKNPLGGEVRSLKICL